MGLRSAFRAFLRLNADPAAALKRSLGACGANVVIRLPSVIECAEKVEIANDVSIASYLHIWGNGGVVIGPRTMIASHVAITSATHDPDSPEMIGTMVTAPIRIENDVWIGSHAVILPGVVIGCHSVVAAGSVVREDVPPFAVVAGVPAKVVRTKATRAEAKPL